MNNDQMLMPKSWHEKSKPHLFCPGCGHGIVLKQLGYAIDELNIQSKTTLGIDIGCSLLAWNFFDIDTVQTHHGRTVPVISGYKMMKPKRVAIAYVGDGGGYAIGLQALLHSAFRNDPIFVMVINNGNYAMTGGQAAPTTNAKDATPTSPVGIVRENGFSFHGPELISNLCSKKAYIARFSVSKPLLVKNAIKNALINQIKNNSFSFLEVLSICPTNWRMNAKQCFKKLDQIEETYKVGEFVGGSNGKN